MADGPPPDAIGDIDSVARDLYLRAKQCGPEFAEVATAVRRLHTVLRHLRAEAHDPDSLLSCDSKSIFVRQLQPVIEDCDFTLKQLETIIKKYGAVGSGARTTNLEERERDMIKLIRSKICKQKTNIDIFLDTVQLHNPAKTQRPMAKNDSNLEVIKQQLDAIAEKLFRGREIGGDEDDIWKQFRSALEAEGFSKEVLNNNKVVIHLSFRTSWAALLLNAELGDS